MKNTETMKPLHKVLIAAAGTAAIWQALPLISDSAGEAAGEAARLEVEKPKPMELLTEVEVSAQAVVIDRDQANRPGATPVSAVDYNRSLDRLAAAEKAAEEGGVASRRIASAKERGETNAREWFAKMK